MRVGHETSADPAMVWGQLKRSESGRREGIFLYSQPNGVRAGASVQEHYFRYQRDQFSTLIVVCQGSGAGQRRLAVLGLLRGH